MPMTDEQARQEALRRWGADAVVSYDETTCLELFLVGVHPRGAEPTWHGQGRTWELAFAAADLDAERARN